MLINCQSKLCHVEKLTKTLNINIIIINNNSNDKLMVLMFVFINRDLILSLF